MAGDLVMFGLVYKHDDIVAPLYGLPVLAVIDDKFITGLMLPEVGTETLQNVLPEHAVYRLINMIQITKEAEEFIVEQYRRLRQRDCSGVMKSAWRITVRQLESLIRLSESMARMHCSDEVQPKHVKEAFRLLSKSIIRVDTPDVTFDPGEGEKIVEGECDNPGASNTEAMETNQPEETEKLNPSAPLKMSFSEYKQISNLLVFYLQKMEESGDDCQLTKSDLVNWYLKEIENEIETETELILRKRLIEKVIYRLIHSVSILVSYNINHLL
ncbi:hypothetical protein GDO78_021578 [Eleutherodactylus coqui]|uniref:MCM AAA-lid domain-containing protein n=1 Tax=Eleutherodactylus coqui TaxID=57060 RepID=A0A8J6B3M1_ELECQ|nr:hypothetical protein GDO78_021578 [Eleutherodactylus coqui]